MPRRLTKADRERIRAEVKELAKKPRGEIVFGPSPIGFTPKQPKEPQPEEENDAAGEL
jgi:hypothetical protein